MTNGLIPIARKSLHAHAFEHYLRTGRRIELQPRRAAIERKFNPYHDPDNGQFTFAPGGRRSGTSRPSSQRGSDAPKPGVSANPAKLLLAQYRPNPRARIGGNRGPALNDPMTLERAFPGLRNAPGSSIVTLADNMLDITGPASRLTTELAQAESRRLIEQVKQIDPEFQYERLGSPTTLEGQINEIRTLRMHRAAARYNKLGDDKPLQVEVLRQIQDSVDRAYDEGVELFDAGRLKPRLSRNEAIGNYVDRTVRRDMRRLFDRYGIRHGSGQPVRVVGREYDTSGSDRTFRIPDARVGRIAYDSTLERKLPSKLQIRGFFNSDFRPSSVVIVRPRQLGPKSTYVIKKPGN